MILIKYSDEKFEDEYFNIIFEAKRLLEIKNIERQIIQKWMISNPILSEGKPSPDLSLKCCANLTIPFYISYITLIIPSIAARRAPVACDIIHTCV